MADAAASKAAVRKGVRVRVPLRARQTPRRVHQCHVARGRNSIGNHDVARGDCVRGSWTPRVDLLASDRQHVGRLLSWATWRRADGPDHSARPPGNTAVSEVRSPMRREEWYCSANRPAAASTGPVHQRDLDPRRPEAWHLRQRRLGAGHPLLRARHCRREASSSPGARSTTRSTTLRQRRMLQHRRLQDHRRKQVSCLQRTVRSKPM